MARFTPQSKVNRDEFGLYPRLPCFAPSFCSMPCFPHSLQDFPDEHSFYVLSCAPEALSQDSASRKHNLIHVRLYIFTLTFC